MVKQCRTNSLSEGLIAIDGDRIHDVFTIVEDRAVHVEHHWVSNSLRISLQTWIRISGEFILVLASSVPVSAVPSPSQSFPPVISAQSRIPMIRIGKPRKRGKSRKKRIARYCLREYQVKYA